MGGHINGRIVEGQLAANISVVIGFHELYRYQEKTLAGIEVYLLSIAKAIPISMDLARSMPSYSHHIARYSSSSARRSAGSY